MIGMHLLKDVKITKIENVATAGTSTLTTDVIDMQGFEGVMILVDLAAVTDDSVLDLIVYNNASNSASGGTAITGGTTGNNTAATSGNKFMVVDVYRPTLRYVYAEFERATQNAAVGGIYAFQYGAHVKPVSQSSGLLDSAFAIGD
jgi:hypothetical protein